jgi:hypothetical protein
MHKDLDHAEIVELLKENFGTDFTVDAHLTRSIMSGQCVAFIGAGFSKGVTNMDWNELIKKLVDHVWEEAKKLEEADCSDVSISGKIEKANYIKYEFNKLQKGMILQPTSCPTFQHYIIQHGRQRHVSHI